MIWQEEAKGDKKIQRQTKTGLFLETLGFNSV